MDRDQIRAGLENAGLSTYQADAYLTLLEHGVLPAVDVAKNCSVPVPRIYDVLKDLEQRDYIETLDRDTLHARARNPVDVIQDLHARSELLSDAAGAIEDRWERSPIGDHEMNVVRNADTVIDHAREAIRNADTVVDLAVSADQLSRFETALQQASENDVVVRASLYCEDDDSTPFAEQSIADVATEIRGRTIPGPLLVLVDRQTTCFSPTTRMIDPYGVVVNDDILSFIFHWYFQTCLWSVWETVHEHQSCPVEYVNLEEFIRDVFVPWRDGARVTVTVEGIDTRSGDSRELTGTILDVGFTDPPFAGEHPPTYEQLAGQASLLLATDDHVYQIGSWGALFEDIEAWRIVLRSVEMDPPAGSRVDLDPVGGDASSPEPSS